MKHLSELNLCGMQSTALLFPSVIYSIIKTVVDFNGSEVVPSAVWKGNSYETFSGLLIFPLRFEQDNMLSYMNNTTWEWI